MHKRKQLEDLAREVQVLKDQHFCNSETLQNWLTTVNDLAQKKGVGFLGPSRSGKSSLLNKLLGENFLPDSDFLEGKNGVANRGTTSVVTEIIINRDFTDFLVSVLLVSEQEWLSLRQIFENMVLPIINKCGEAEGECVDPDLKDLMTNFLESIMNITDIQEYLKLSKNEDFLDPVVEYLRSNCFQLQFVAKDRKEVRNYLADYGAGVLPLSVLSHRIIVEGPFQKSLIHDGAVLIDIPGSNDLDARREAQRLKGIREIRKAILLAPKNIFTPSTKTNIEHMMGANLFQGSLVVKTQFLTLKVVNKWMKKGEITKENLPIKLGETDSQKALNRLIHTELKCNSTPPQCLSYDYLTDTMDEEYNQNVLSSIVNHLNTLTVDETQILEQLPLVLAQVADETCTTRPIIPINIDPDMFMKLETNWMNSANDVSENLCELILTSSLSSYQYNFKNWRSARNWVHQLRMIPSIRHEIKKMFDPIFNHICVQLRQWITNITESYCLPTNKNYYEFVDNLPLSFIDDLSNLIEIIQNIVDSIHRDSYVPVRERRDISPYFGAPFDFLYEFKSQIMSPATQHKLKRAFHRDVQRLWRTIQMHLRQLTFKFNTFRTRTPFVAQLDSLTPEHIDGISAILDFVEKLRSRNENIISSGIPPYSVNDNTLQVGPRFKAQNVINVLEEQLKIHREVTVVILRFLDLHQDDLIPILRVLSLHHHLTAIDFSGNELNLDNSHWGRSINAVAAAFMANRGVSRERNRSFEIRYQPSRTQLNKQFTITSAHWIIIFDSTLPGAVAGSECLRNFCTEKQLSYSDVDITQPNAWNTLVQEGRAKLLVQPLALYFACHGGMSFGGVSVICAKGARYCLSDLIDGTARQPCAIILDSCQTLINTTAEDIQGSCLLAQSAPTRRVAFDDTRYVRCLVEEFNRPAQPLHSAIANAHRNFTNMNIGELPIVRIYGGFPVQSFFWA